MVANLADCLLTCGSLLIIYSVAIALLAIVLAYVERRRLVRKMHRMRHPITVGLHHDQ